MKREESMNTASQGTWTLNKNLIMREFQFCFVLKWSFYCTEEKKMKEIKAGLDHIEVFAYVQP